MSARHLPPSTMVCPLPKNFSGVLDCAHDGNRAERKYGCTIRFRQFRTPNRKDCRILFQRSIPNQQSHQVSLLLTTKSVPAGKCTMVVQDNIITSAKFSSFDPFRLANIARHAPGAQYFVVGGET